MTKEIDAKKPKLLVKIKITNHFLERQGWKNLGIMTRKFVEFAVMACY